MSSVEALRRYGKHDWDCAIRLLNQPCNCGLDAAIKAAQTQGELSNWEDEARRYAQNADYWRNRCEIAEGVKRFDDPQPAVSAGQPSAISDERPGWVSVPREPTPEMWDAAWNSIGLPYRAKLSMHEIKTLFDKFHSAMLAAAPKETK